MTIRELIEELQKFDPELELGTEVDSEATRTGDYFLGIELKKLTLQRTTYGGYNEFDATSNAVFTILR